MFDSEEKEQYNQKDPHFAKELYDVDQDCLIVVEKELTDVFVVMAVVVHIVLQKIGVLLRNDQTLVNVLVNAQPHQPAKNELLAEIEQQASHQN